MGDSQQTSTTSSAPSNPNVNATVDKVLGGVNTALDKGPAVFNDPLYAGTGATTQQGWQSALTAANNPGYSSAVNGAITGAGDLIGSGGKTAAMSDLERQYGDLGGAYDSANPGAQTLRNNLIDDTMTNVNSVFNNSGRFGGGSHAVSLGEGVGNAVAGFDSALYDKSMANRYNSLAGQQGIEQSGVTNMLNAGNALPGYFQSSLLPGQAIGAVGSAQDADKQAALLAKNDLFRRQNDAQRDLVGWGGSVLSGPANASGTTTTQTQPGTPWWQSAIGLGIGAAGAFL